MSWWVARDKSGAYVDRLEFLDDVYVEDTLSPESMARLTKYLGVNYTNYSKLKIDMRRRTIWFDGLDLLFLSPDVPGSTKDGCPKCGDRGKFIRMALCCPKHGAFGGI